MTVAELICFALLMLLNTAFKLSVFAFILDCNNHVYSCCANDANFEKQTCC